METIDLARDPCADAIARAMTRPMDSDTAATSPDDGPDVVAPRTPRERPIKYVQHPSYTRFLRPDRLAA